MAFFVCFNVHDFHQFSSLTSSLLFFASSTSPFSPLRSCCAAVSASCHHLCLICSCQSISGSGSWQHQELEIDHEQSPSVRPRRSGSISTWNSDRRSTPRSTRTAKLRFSFRVAARNSESGQRKLWSQGRRHALDPTCVSMLKCSLSSVSICETSSFTFDTIVAKRDFRRTSPQTCSIISLMVVTG